MSEKIKKIIDDMDIQSAKIKKSIDEMNVPINIPSMTFTDIPVKIPQSVIIEGNKLNPAKGIFERLILFIQRFESDLDLDHEIGMRFVSFGNSTIYNILDIDYLGPDIITFYAQSEDGQKVQLIQNISQLSILLTSAKKLQEKPKRLGFNLDQKSPENKKGSEKMLEREK